MKLQHEIDVRATVPASILNNTKIAFKLEPSAYSAHDMGTLTFALNGVIVVSSPEGYWVLPPTRALWLAPSVRHSVRSLGEVLTRRIALEPMLQPQSQQRSCVFDLTPLLRELLNALTENPERDPEDSHYRLLTELLSRQMLKPCAQPLSLPTPREARVGRICNHIQHNLDDDKSLLEWSHELGLHCRTLHRLFIKEVGMSFVQWRQQAKLLSALEELAKGRPILSVALDLGYQTQSAFTVMFRRSLGITPGEFIKSIAVK